MTKGTAGLAGEAREAQGSMYMQQALSPPRRYYTTTKGGGDRGIETEGSVPLSAARWGPHASSA